MAITDLQISDTLETSAPSIRYEGNEGPKSPQEQQQMMTDALLREEYDKYVYDLLEQRPEATPMSFEEFRIMVIGEGQMSSAQPMPNRQMAAYGGIMDTASGRRAYGLGSIFKKITRPIKKVLKSDVGKAAVGAALLGAPFGGGAWFGPGSGFGIGKTGLGSFFGKGSWNPMLRKVGGDFAQSKFGSMMTGFPGGKWGAGLTAATALPFLGVGMGEEESLNLGLNIPPGQKFDVNFSQMRKDIGDAVTSGVEENFHEVLANYGLTEGVNINRWEDIRTGSAEGGRIGLYAGGQSIPSDYTIEDAMMTTTQDKLGGITDVMKQADLYRQGSVGQMYAAQGGRIGYRRGRMAPYAGGEGDIGLERAEDMDPATGTLTEGDIGISAETVPFEHEGAQVQDKSRLLGIVKKLVMEGTAPGLAIQLAKKMIARFKTEEVPEELKSLLEGVRPERPDPELVPIPDWPPRLPPRVPDWPPRLPPRNVPKWEQAEEMEKFMMNKGGRIGAQEGGLMNLGGMEKDYRNDGGFVPIGEYEKKDDVPARLSKNEFVFTADAVRGAGGGDIDKGAEIMENVMKNLEQGGQISEESQGLGGAQEMFDVSERLSEVV